MSKQLYDVALTTFDNPFDPLDDFTKWLEFDMEKGYNTTAYLDRVSHTSEAFTDYEIARELERAIDEIIAVDPFDIYRKVKRIAS